jgi:aryl-alcohol dehydrogenase-like predicted oxidoreductase
VAVTFSSLGLGAGPLGDERLEERDVERLVHTALELGITLFDTARSYGASEARLGRLLHGRTGVAIATKGGYGVDGVPDWTADAIRLGIDQAIGRLRTERLDVFFLHSCALPTASDERILAELDRARSEGKIRFAGYSGDGEALAWAVRSGRFDVVECSVSVVDQAALASSIPEARSRGVHVVAKRALINGAYRFASRPAADDVATSWDRLQAMALDPAPLEWPELALRFAAYAPGVTSTLVGTTRPEHLRAAAAAHARGPLDDATLSRVRAAWDPAWPGMI